MINSNIAIDFGASNIKIYLDGKGILVNEPAFMAVDNKDEVIGIGREAYQMIGRTGKKITVGHPFQYGVISNYAMAEHMAGKYIKRVGAGKIFLPAALVTVPVNINEIERHALVDIIEEAGIRKINFIYEPFACGLGIDLEIFSSKASLILDIGASKTTASVISSGRIHSSEMIKLGGNDFNDDIIRYIKKKYFLEIGRLSASLLKYEIGSVSPRERTSFCHVKGKDINTDMPKDVTINSDDMVEALLDSAIKITELLQNILSDLPVSMMTDISESGIALTGAGAGVYGIEQLIARKTGIDTYLPEGYSNAQINGAGQALKLQNKTSARTIFI